MSRPDPATLVREDAEARRDAQRVFDRPLVLEAGAGTGKTTTLVARILAWSLGPGWIRARDALAVDGRAAPERVAARVLGRVVAITFTEAAAAEMSRRIGGALLELERGGEPEGLLMDGLEVSREERCERARALRSSLDHLVAQTIHAYCRRLLVTHPLEAGLHPRLEIDADGRLQREVVRQVLEEALATAYVEPGGDPDFLALAARGISPRDLESELLLLLDEGLSARALTADPLSPDAVCAFGARLADAVAAFRGGPGERLLGVGGIAGEVAERIARLDARLAQAPPASAEALAGLARDLASEWQAKHVDRVRTWSKPEFNVGESKALGGLVDVVPGLARALHPMLRQTASLDPELLALARRVLLRLLRESEERLRERGIATFSALLSGARELLASSPGVAARLRGCIDQLLVDEFQDTDSRQCDIVRVLALDGPDGERPGLFVVGDPKQSIYGWRNADLAAYDAFVEYVLDRGGRRMRLSVNYRSAPEILAEVERVVEPVMTERRGVQPGFQRLTAADGNPEAFAPGGSDRRAPVEYWVSAEWDAERGEPARTRAQRAARIEARALARDLRALHDEHGVAWKRIGVLFRSRGDWDIYLRELRECGVPYAVEGDRQYYRRREIADAAALVRCVLDPNDHVALVSVLRSPAVGVPDAALIPLWVRDFPGLASRLYGCGGEGVEEIRRVVAEAAARLPDDVPGLARVGGWDRSLCAALEALAHLRQRFDEDPADVFVECLRRVFPCEAGESARYAGVWRAANLDRFFRGLAEELDADGAHVVLRRLRRALADEEREEEGRPVGIVEDAVQILTIHGAKGLDFEHVYVMQLHKGSAARDEARVGAAGGELAYRLFTAPSLDWDRFLAARRRMEEAERVRLLYVAMTRAKRRLVLAGLWPELQRGGARGTMLESFGGRDAPDVAVAMAAAAGAGRDGEDAFGARWLYPSLSAPWRGAPAAAGSAPRLPDAPQVRRASERLAAERESARLREERAMGGAASLQAHEESLDERAELGFGETADGGAPGRPMPNAGRDDGVARAVGTAIHRALETIDLSAERGEELALRREAMALDLERLLTGAPLARARDEASVLFDGIARGSLMARLRELADRVVARELPVIASPDEDGPVGFVSGSIDLVYRDPETDELVVADYKTDRLEDDAQRGDRTRAYALQGAVYQRALREALGLAYTPRFELWYLRLDRIERVAAA